MSLTPDDEEIIKSDDISETNVKQMLQAEGCGVRIETDAALLLTFVKLKVTHAQATVQRSYFFWLGDRRSRQGV